VALTGGAGGVQRQQFGGGVARLLGGLALGLVPLAGTQRMQRRGFRIGAGVTGNDVQLRHRHEQLGVVGVMQFEEFLFAQPQVHADQPLIAADAVAFMDDRIADLEFGQVFQPVVETGLSSALRAGCAVACRRTARFR
jgi:hypothetical protein